VVIGWVRFPGDIGMCANRAMDSLSGLSLGIMIKTSFSYVSFSAGKTQTTSAGDALMAPAFSIEPAVWRSWPIEAASENFLARQ
jgi:hypothetical protein